jgi:adenine C2-methylase RlmN of 23S rRNA A2503 and tRNA A37
MSASKILKSTIDKSVNWVTPFKRGTIETRFVQKKPEYFIGYVSSHSGCKMGCKFCYLTQQNQTTFDHVTVEKYVDQFKTVINYYGDRLHPKKDVKTMLNIERLRKYVAHHTPIYGSNDPFVVRAVNTLKQEEEELIPIESASRMNINFMARGEPLANKYVVNEWSKIASGFEQANPFNLMLKNNISTIMPNTIKHRKLSDIFGIYKPHVYYSMYSVDNEFRDEWIPNAMPVEQALEKLKEYEDFAPELKTPVTFHWAYIKGHNDNLEKTRELAKLIKGLGFRAKFNLVRFNPHPNLEAKGICEPDEGKLQELFDIISDALGHPKSYIVPRVGKDVFASCGMFIDQ